MYQQMMNNGLPVSDMQVDRGAMMYNLPQNPSMVPSNVQLSPNMAPYLKLITGFCMKELQEGTTKNNLRVFAFNFLSANMWNNQPFMELVVSVAEFSEFLAMTRNQPIQGAIQFATEKMVSYVIAAMVQQFPALQQRMDQGQFQDVQLLIQEFNNTLQQVKNFKYQNQQPQQQFQQPQQFNGWGNNVPQQSAFAMAPATPQWNTANSGGGMFSSPMPANNRSDATLPVNRPTYKRNFKMDDDIEEVTFDSRGVQITQPTPNIVSSDGTVLASASGLKRTYTLQTPYACAYNPTQRILFYRQDNVGNVLEVLKPKPEVTVDYSQHELDPMFRFKVKQDELKRNALVAVNWSLPTHSKPIKEIVDKIRVDEPTSTMFLINDPVFIHDRLPVHTFEEAMALTKMNLISKNIDISSDNVVEFSYRKLTPFIFDEEYVESMELLKDSMSKAIDSFESVVELMKAVNGIIPSVIWHNINDRLTAEVNKALKYGMGMELTIEDFVDDVLELSNYITVKHSDATANTFLTKESNIVKQAFKNLKGVQLNEYLISKLGTVPEGMDKRCIVFFEDCWVTTVPWFSSDIKIKMNDKVGAVLESILPDFYASVSGIILRSSKLGCVNRVIYTADNVSINLHESIIGSDFYVISV